MCSTRASVDDAMKTRSRTTTVSDVKTIPLSQHRAAEGLLTVAQTYDHVPFKVERCFIVQPSENGTVRGHHAHRELSQFLICLAGEVEVLVDDSRSRQVHRLQPLRHGILVPPDIWCAQTYTTRD